MSSSLRVVHYLNQFFAGVGGEEKASEGPQVKEGRVSFTWRSYYASLPVLKLPTL